MEPNLQEIELNGNETISGYNQEYKIFPYIWLTLAILVFGAAIILTQTLENIYD